MVGEDLPKVHYFANPEQIASHKNCLCQGRPRRLFLILVQAHSLKSGVEKAGLDPAKLSAVAVEDYDLQVAANACSNRYSGANP